MQCSWEINSFEDTERLALEIKSKIQQTQFIGLTGPMGAGKTYFVKALAKVLNLKNLGAVNSPSFALHQRYEGIDFNLEHLDLFRLESEEELESIGFWDLFAEDKVIIVVEWANRLDPKQIPRKFHPIFLEFEMVDHRRWVNQMRSDQIRSDEMR
jgi:tRNA threonylcarbamoyladenosine biosynthesis protein TsaE